MSDAKKATKSKKSDKSVSKKSDKSSVSKKSSSPDKKKTSTPKKDGSVSGDKSPKSIKGDKSPKSIKGDKSPKAEKPVKGDKSPKAEKSVKGDKSPKADKSMKIDKSAEKILEPTITNSIIQEPEPPKDTSPLIQPLSPPEPKKEQISINCPVHGQPYRCFCEACEEVICDVCQNVGPHNSELHRVVGISEAFNERISYLSSGLYTNLLRKRDELLAQINKVDSKIGEIKNTAHSAEKSVKTEYVEMLERLKSSEGSKSAILQHDLYTLQKDMERIDLILNILDEYNQGESRSDYIGFLSRFKELNDYMEYVMNKPLKQEINVVPNDLPRELTERRKLIERSEISDMILKLRDGIIWDLMQEAKKPVPAEMPSNKPQFLDKYETELAQYELTCTFCGVGLDQFTINTDCLYNRNDAPHEIDESYFSVQAPPKDYIGNDRHFFAKPVRVEHYFLKGIVTDKKAKNAFEILKNKSHDKIKSIGRKIAKIDVDRKGTIEPEKMFEILKAKAKKIPDEDLKSMISKLIPETSISKLVHYKGFLRYLELMRENETANNNEDPELVEFEKAKKKKDKKAKKLAEKSSEKALKDKPESTSENKPENKAENLNSAKIEEKKDQPKVEEKKIEPPSSSQEEKKENISNKPSETKKEDPLNLTSINPLETAKNTNGSSVWHASSSVFPPNEIYEIAPSKPQSIFIQI